MNKKRLLTLTLSAATLAGCAHHEYHHRLPDPTRPQVLVAPGDYLVLNQEPILVVRKGTEQAKITWQLAPGGPVFDAEGIRILGRVKTGGPSPERIDRPDPSQNELFKCAGSETRLEFTCLIAPQVKEGQYAYAISVNNAGKRIVLDPTIMIR